MYFITLFHFNFPKQTAKLFTELESNWFDAGFELSFISPTVWFLIQRMLW